MQKVYYCNIEKLNTCDIDLDSIPEFILKKVSSYKDNLKVVSSLSGYLLLKKAFRLNGIDITDLIYSYTEKGKPYFKDLKYHFSISHSKNIVCVAISDDAVGLDVEYFNESRDFYKLSKYLLTTEENSIYQSLEGLESYKYLYSKWVMKEAHFKMIGCGLTKEFSKCNLSYKVFNLYDCDNNLYFLASTINLEPVKLNI